MCTKSERSDAGIAIMPKILATIKGTMILHCFVPVFVRLAPQFQALLSPRTDIYFPGK
jgi:hypothetical protein